MRVIVAIISALAVLAGTAYLFRAEILLTGIKIMSERRTPIGEHQTIAWQAGPEARDERQNQPNIVLIVADDLGWNDLTFNGGGVAGGTVPTPNIDSIAKDGVNFAKGYAGQGTCAPSRAMMMSGRYGSRFGFEFTPTPPGMMQTLGTIMPRAEGRPPVLLKENPKMVEYDKMGMPTEEITIAEVLKDQGYYTAHIGKWHLGRANGSAPQDQGFDQSLLMHSGLYMAEDDPNVVNSKLSYDPIDRFLWAGMLYAASYNGGDAFEPGGYLTDYYTEEAVKVIENNQNRPFFLYLAHWAPHTPLQATKADYDALSHIENHTERVYAAMIRALDRGVGQVLDKLKETGLEENTIVIFTSDNGGAAYVGIDDLNKPLRGWKITNFEGGIRVPYFIKWPAALAAGQTYEKPVHHFDIYATAAKASGASPTHQLDGVDLLPYVSGEADREQPHDTLFWRAGEYRSIRHHDWKLVYDPQMGNTFLFDLATDPGESTDVAEQNPEMVTEIMTLLAEHNSQMVPPIWDSVAARAINVDKHILEEGDPSDTYVYWSN
jgi:uncharacterized sulfatase